MHLPYLPKGPQSGPVTEDKWFCMSELYCAEAMQVIVQSRIVKGNMQSAGTCTSVLHIKDTDNRTTVFAAFRKYFRHSLNMSWKSYWAQTHQRGTTVETQLLSTRPLSHMSSHIYCFRNAT